MKVDKGEFVGNDDIERRALIVAGTHVNFLNSFDGNDPLPDDYFHTVKVLADVAEGVQNRAMTLELITDDDGGSTTVFASFFEAPGDHNDIDFLAYEFDTTWSVTVLNGDPVGWGPRRAS